MSGWIKLHRKLLDNHNIKNGDWLKVWIFLLLKASHTGYKTVFGNETIDLKPGQLITSRKSISQQLGVQESKTERIIKRLKTEHQIEQQSSSRSRLITITNWNQYQKDEQQNEPQVNSKRTANEQQMNTNKKVKKEKKVNNVFIAPTLKEITDYCLLRKNSVNPQRWLNHYTANGWKIGKAQMKDWKAAVRTWEYTEQKKPIGTTF